MRGRHVDGELVLLWNVDLSEAELVRDGGWPAGPLLLRDGDVGHVAHVHLHVENRLRGCEVQMMRLRSMFDSSVEAVFLLFYLLSDWLST